MEKTQSSLASLPVQAVSRLARHFFRLRVLLRLPALCLLHVGENLIHLFSCHLRRLLCIVLLISLPTLSLPHYHRILFSQYLPLFPSLSEMHKITFPYLHLASHLHRVDKSKLQQAVHVYALLVLFSQTPLASRPRVRSRCRLCIRLPKLRSVALQTQSKAVAL